MATILATMLQRLYAGILRGPSVYARPGRQRVDWQDFRHFAGTDPAMALATLLGEARRIEFPARVKEFETPAAPEEQWTAEQKTARDAYRRQTAILQKVRDIAEDARDFQNDHGESALFVGFPLLWLPRADLLKGGSGRETRVLAPLAFVPVSLEVRRGGRPGVALSCLGEGSNLLIPNPALGAWIEQQTGQTYEELDADAEGADPWKELAGMIAWVRKTLDLSEQQLPDFTAETPVKLLKEIKELPTEPALISSAVLGLFPMANLGLLRDTRWMIEQEAGLQGPVRTFLKPAALEVTASEPAEAELAPSSTPQLNGQRDFASETLVTHADPCQTAAVRHARASDALVIHGPPGTGKSQTIANIIGDHLARGERVLFVCDKRTAIDVVKYRLDALGLGVFCGVVHDPARDRTSLYRQLRDYLENLADSAPDADPTQELAAVNTQLTKLHGELTAAYRALNRGTADAISFHEMAGEWLELVAAAPPITGEPASAIATSDVRQHQTDLDEILRRAARIAWPGSPWHGRLEISVADFLAYSPADWQRKLEPIITAARSADEFADEQLMALDPQVSAMEQAAARRELAAVIDQLGNRGLAKFCTRLAGASPEEVASLISEKDSLAGPMSEIETAPLEAELRATVLDAPPTIAELNARLQAIEAYLPIVSSLKRFFAFGAKKAAQQALAPLALPVTPENLHKARAFYRGVRARNLAGRFLQTCVGEEARSFPDDGKLKLDWQRVHEALTAARLVRQPSLLSVSEAVQSTLADLSGAPNVSANLRMSADRAERLAAVEAAVHGAELFATAAKHELFARWRGNIPCTTEAEAWLKNISTLEEAVRLTDALTRLPEALAGHVRWHADRGADPKLALTAIRRSACESELRTRTRLDSVLQTVDTERVESAFRTLADLAGQKQQLVRALTRRRWQIRQRERLLAGTGSRLNGVGASLKQRLVTRGERALKLRQMLATGAAIPDGDPLFDLCPVWMTSPATVAQVFPRTPLFDVVVFDEASQCRLEEALPVLLRARRVVVAGDPKQLPPTRFFESGLADSAETDAETAEELFEQQQSEVEDLLGAALNLNVQEAFLDVHYRSRDESLIGFSNEQFYGTRLQPIPGHPKNKALQAPLRIHRVDGIYENRANRAEAEKVVELVADLLAETEPPSIGIACFNLPQRDLIIDLLDEKAERESAFAGQLATARERRGRDSFEGLFVKNLENVQGDERDVMIICTTFAPDPKGKFRRNFGALSGSGGGRRLNVLVTRARTAIHLITSIPRSEYAALPPVEPGRMPNGRFFLYAYLRYAEWLATEFEEWQSQLENLRADPHAECQVQPSAQPSRVAQALGSALRDQHSLGTIVHWGNDGFCVDAAVVHPGLPADVTIGVLTDFNRFAKTPDPIEWELFRSAVLKSQGWNLHRTWSPALLRDWQRELKAIHTVHEIELRQQTAAKEESQPAAEN